MTNIVLILIELNIQIAGNVIITPEGEFQIVEHNSFIQSTSGYNTYVDEYLTDDFFMVVYTYSERNDKRVVIHKDGQAKTTWTEVKIATLKTVKQ